MSKKCPHCGHLLHTAAFKCAHCSNWVNDFFFTQHGDEDDHFIKNPKGDITLWPPSLVTVMVIDLIKDISLENSLQPLTELTGQKLKGKQQFNLLIFYSFCYFAAIRLHAWMKRWCRHTIERQLRDALLDGIVSRCEALGLGYEESTRILRAGGESLYDKFDDIWKDLGTDTPSQVRDTKALASAVYGDKQANILNGLPLYEQLMSTVWNLREPFREIFLVEEKDFDWQTITGGLHPYDWIDRIRRVWRDGQQQ